jgi:RND superfamily putative drug exporter
MGRWSASHWKTAVFGWLAFVIASIAIGGQVGTRHLDDTDTNVGEARKADKLVNAGFPADKDKQGEIVLIQSDKYTADDPQFRVVVNDVQRALEQFPKVTELESPLAAGNEDQVSADGHSAMVTFTPKGDYDEAIAYIQTIEAAVDKVAQQHDDFYVDELGSASSGRALDEAFMGMLATAGMVAIPLALVILLFVFGSAVAAFVPLLLAITAVMATTALVALPSQIVPVEETISEVILLIGLAVGIDYSLFYLRREREERAAGRSERAALEAAAATSGRAVLISGVTVMIAMAGMFFAQDKTFTGFAIGTMMVVAVAMLGSLTVLPALLAKLGDRVEKGRIPFVHRLRAKTGDARTWGWIVDRVMRRPALWATAAAALLVALTIPAFQLNNASTSLDDISIAEVEPIKKFEDAFPGGNEPAVVAIQADDVRSAEVRGAVEELVSRAEASDQLGSPIEVETSKDNRVVQVAIPLAGNGTDEVSKAALSTLREELVPQTVGEVEGVEYAVGGFTAADVDWNDNMKTAAPLVFAFVLVFAFALLLVSFRSIVIALKAIVLNLLSVGAAYGILVAAFQWGWGESFFDFESNGGITPWLPMFLFVILFGLSMDYHVFIISRIREAYDRGLKTDEAISHGIKTTAGVVTSAAVVMVATFSVFAILPLIDMKEMGVGLAAAVLIDATIIRAVLLPATMKLLGEANWYLPRWLQWLPRLEHEPAPVTEAPALPKAA